MSSESDAFANLFGHLELEDPADIGGNEALSTKTGKGKTTERTAEAPEKSIEIEEIASSEKAFEVWCFVEDLDQIRIAVQETWIEYCQGRLSLIAACRVTETAFGIMRRMDNQMVAKFPDLTRLDKLLRALGFEYAQVLCNNKPTPSVCCPTDDHKDNNRMVIFTIGSLDKLCQAGLTIAYTHFCASDRVKHDMAIFSADPSKSLDFSANEKELSDDDFDPFPRAFAARLLKIILNTAISDFKKYKPRDELMAGFDNAARTGELRYWHSAALQIYCDVYDLVGSHHDAGVECLVEGMHRERAVYARLQAFRPTAPLGRCLVPHYWDQMVRCVDATDEQLRKLAPRELRLPTIFGVSADFTAKDMYGHFPVAAINFLVWSRDITFNCSLQFANEYLSLLGMAHLYKAMRHFNLLHVEWPDMDWLISMQSSRRQFVQAPGPGADAMAYCRHLQIAIGISASALSRRARKRDWTLAEVYDRRRLLTITSEYRQAELDLMISDNALGLARGDRIDGILKRMTEKSSTTTKRTNQKITALQLLQTYKDNFIAGEVEGNFNLSGLYMDCSELLVAMDKALYGNTKKVARPPQLFERPDFLPEGLLHEAGYLQEHGISLQISSIAQAAKMLETHIAAHGDDYLRVAQE